MTPNVELFSVYAADIFRHLYDEFPTASRINPGDFTRPNLDLALDERVKKLQLTVDKADLFSLAKELSDSQKERVAEIRTELRESMNEKRANCNRHNLIFEGTLTFLREEGYIRETETGEYQLSAKGFSHLNKNFSDGSISDHEKSYISVIKTMFSTIGSISQSMSSGVIVKLVTDFLSP